MEARLARVILSLHAASIAMAWLGCQGWLLRASAGPVGNHAKSNVFAGNFSSGRDTARLLQLALKEVAQGDKGLREAVLTEECLHLVARRAGAEGLEAALDDVEEIRDRSHSQYRKMIPVPRALAHHVIAAGLWIAWIGHIAGRREKKTQVFHAWPICSGCNPGATASTHAM